MAIRFNGSTYARCTTDTPIKGTQWGSTFSIWVKLHAKPNNMIFLGSFSNSGLSAGQYLSYVSSTDQIAMTTYRDTIYRSSVIACPPIGEWFHVAGTCSGSTNRRVYVNGTAGSVVTNSLADEGLEEITIGVWRSVSAVSSINVWAEMADASIWWEPMSQTRIQSLADGVSPISHGVMSSGSLAAYYPLNDPNDFRNKAPRQQRRFHMDVISGRPLAGRSEPPALNNSTPYKLTEKNEPKIIAAPSPYISGARIRDRWAGLGRRY